jgi:CxxC motif-containing protein
MAEGITGVKTGVQRKFTPLSELQDEWDFTVERKGAPKSFKFTLDELLNRHTVEVAEIRVMRAELHLLAVKREATSAKQLQIIDQDNLLHEITYGLSIIRDDT